MDWLDLLQSKGLLRVFPVYETAKETLMYRTVFWTLVEGERGMIWENGIEIRIISYME